MTELAKRLLARDRDAVPQALNLVDDRRPERRAAALRLLDSLEREARFPGAPRVGLTGSPGSGKSTLLDALVRSLRQRGETVGIVAVDPSSQRTGGALLGDRVRVRASAGDPGVFLRSMAARERLGGVADATRASVVILAAVFERVFVETVGVGQSEAEVAWLVDTVVYVAQPGSGDTLQFMKAGVLEHPDVFVVNKADLGPAAERTGRDLETGVALGARQGDWSPPVVLTSARDGAGIPALLEALDAHREFLERSGKLAERRRRGLESSIRETLVRRYGTYGIERIGGEAALRTRLRASTQGGLGVLEDLEREIEDALRKPD